MNWLSGTRLSLLALSLLGIALASGNAQQIVAKPPVKTPAAGGNSFAGPQDIRYEVFAEGGDHLIDRFIGSWQDSAPRVEHGSLVLRDILTNGNNLIRRSLGPFCNAPTFWRMVASSRMSQPPLRNGRPARGLLH